jgi:hypothetical protein
MRDSKVIQGIAGLVTLGAAAFVCLTLQGGCSPRLDYRPHEAAGWFMARETLRHLKPGGQVIVITRDTTTFENPATDVQMASFRKTLREARVIVGSVQSLQVDPLRPVEVPSGDFQEMIGKAPKGSVIVSFMGPPPLLSSAQRRRLEETKPAIVAFCPGSLTERVNLPALFEQGLLQTAVVSRRNPPPSSARPKGLQAWFDQAFIGIASTDAAGLSLRSDAQPQGRFP